MSRKTNLILLPGNSPNNRGWIEEVKSMLRPKYKRIKVQYYDHWSLGGGFKVKSERQKLREATEKFKSYAIFAKSVGVFLAIDSINNELIKPKHCIFCGTTTRSAQMLQNWSTPTLFIQESLDPFLNIQDLMPIVESMESDHIELAEVPGNKHMYEDIELINQKIEEFLK